MKRSKIFGLAALAAIAFSFGSCKDKDTTVSETESTEINTESGPMESTSADTTHTETTTTVNDSNVSGTTSGEMEQVP